jgi:monothiol glutaredoxin
MAIIQISATELQAMREAGEPFELVDVRTRHERSLACIEGSRLLDDACYDALVALDRATPMVFQCHHGIRSQSAAQHFEGLGFTRLYNLRGGIEAWSTEVDPAVPRY